MPSATEPPATPNPDTPNPDTPNPDTPNPDTPNPDTPNPSTPNPSTPNPSTPNPSTPNPSTPNPSTPNPSTPNPSTPNPGTPNPGTPNPGTPNPGTPNPGTHGTRTLAAAVFLGITLMLIAGGYGYYRMVTADILAQQSQFLSAIGQLKSNEIEQWTREIQREAELLSESAFLQQSVRDLKAREDRAPVQKSLRERMRDDLGTRDNLALVTPEGSLLFWFNPQPESQRPILSHSITTALASDKPIIGDFKSGVIEISMAVRDDKGKPIAVMLWFKDPQDYLYPLIQSWPVPSRSAETLLVKRDGNQVIFLNHLRHQTPSHLFLRFPLSRTDIPAVQATLGKQGIFQGYDYRGIPVLADLRPIPGTQWFIVAKMDRDEILAEAQYRTLVICLVIGLLSLLTAAAVAYAFRQHQSKLFHDLYHAQHQKTLAEQTYQLLFESMLDGFALCEILYDSFDQPNDYRYLSVNPAFEKLTGLSAEDVLNRTALEVMPETEPSWIQRYGHVALTGVGVQFEDYSNALKRYLKVAAFRPAPGQFAVIFMDVTARKHAEAQLRRTIADLERSNTELEQFAYIASHDLQEPLRMVSSYTQLLDQRYGEQLDDKAKKYIHYAVDGAVRMQTLINDLLAYSRVGSQSRPPTDTDSLAALNAASRNLTTLIEESQSLITHDTLPTLHADPSQLALVFQNLLSNAIKFRGSEPPRIHVSAKKILGHWLFSLKDNGIGIEPQHAQRVFVIFQRLHTRAEYPGTGIGLAVCQRIITRHGGKIWFDSTLGQSTTFFFTLPR